MQKLINDPADAVAESLQGLQLAYPHLVCVHLEPVYVRRRDAPVAGKVAVLSGSGSGHEPLDIGYVGRGMLDAACPGPVFTSPTPGQFYIEEASLGNAEDATEILAVDYSYGKHPALDELVPPKLAKLLCANDCIVTRNFSLLEPGVFAEPWITGAEYTVAVLQGRALPSIRIETPAAFYDYQAKYFRNDTKYHCPSGLSAEAEKHLASLALATFAAVGAEGWGRADFMMDETGRPYLLEINTVPGMTDHSLVPMAARALDITFEQLAWQVLETSFSRTRVTA